MEIIFKAKLSSLTKIVINVIGINHKSNESFYILKDGVDKIKFNIIHRSFIQNTESFEIELNEPFDFAHQYFIDYKDFPLCLVDVSHFAESTLFDELFYYDGDDLGAIYSKNKTSFALWAPLATSVNIRLYENDSYSILPMKRTDKGVYRLDVEKDLLNFLYDYEVTNNGMTKISLDPYGKGTGLNSLHSAVVDIERVKQLNCNVPDRKINHYSDAIIYELNVRDFTEDKNTNILNKGKYLGLIEENRTTKQNNPAGLDYLKYLNITHVQLNPVIDFGSVLDNSDKLYNWGYDPISFFALEGSYSLDPSNPMERLIEFKTLVSKLHKNNIRVIMDVVYNHIYDFKISSFEKCVPNYYFRKTKDGRIACASGCGDDVASERKMVSKIIVDSMKYFVDVFDIDGFRFDLMGLIDIDTINAGTETCLKIKNDLMFYGEGWNMGEELPLNKKGCSENHKALHNMAFFNDSYRDLIKGSTFEPEVKGYICGNIDYVYGVDFSFHASILPLSYKPKFENANQSVNYLECHDNYTLFDKLRKSNFDEDDHTLLERIKFANSLIMLSFGIPFIHMGQEIGLSKGGLDNTYNLPNVNRMNYSLLDERFEMVSYFRLLTNIRSRLPYIKFADQNSLSKIFEINHLTNGLYELNSKNNDFILPFKELKIFLNPTLKSQIIHLDKEYILLKGEDGNKESEDIIYYNDAIISPCSSVILFIRKEEN